MNERPLNNSPWSQTMSKIHTSSITIQDDDVDESIPRLDNSIKWMPLQDEPTTTNSQHLPRKRNNSLIPVELMKNNSGEGGRECVALATVFGVPEYVDSKIFWERHHDGSKQNNKHHGHVSINNVSIVSRPLLSSVETTTDSFPTQHEIRSNKLLISSYLDSVLDSVGSNDILTKNPLFLTDIASISFGPTPIPSRSFSLPHIPTVSKFDDLMMIEETPTTTDEVAVPLPSSVVHSEDDSSTKSSKTPFLFVGPPEIFDLILSDEDERFIIWGPDPIFLSSSMATATTTLCNPMRPSSYADLYNSQHKRPELKGFSSNTTTKSSNSSNSNNASPSLLYFKKRNNSKNRASLDLSHKSHSQLFKKAFKLVKPSRTTANVTVKDNNDDEDNIPKVIEAATIHKLVEKLTSTLDYTFMTDFFLTYRDFLNSNNLCQLIISRFYWALQKDEESRKIVRIRTFVVLRHWLNNYFVHDFIGNQALRVLLTDFLNQLPRHPLIQRSPRDQRIVKILKRVVRRLKKLYYDHSPSRVKVIAPPPPTVEQEELGDRVRAKLSQSAIRRKAARIDLSSHHHGNVAVQDARYAPVLVIGSLNVKPSTHFLIDSGLVVGDTSSFIPTTQEELAENVQRRSIMANNNNESSVVSVASDDSLESDLTAGETVTPDMSDHSEDDNDDVVHEYSEEDDEIDRHWLQEQQETMAYFKSLKEQQQQHENDVPSEQQQQNVNETPVNDLVPLEDMSEPDKETPVVLIDKPPLTLNVVRRVPSERWCKSSSDDSPILSSTNTAALPDELLKELVDDPTLQITVGLSRKLSRKSIERRKSERSLQDLLSSQPPSPHLAAVQQDNSHDKQVPELPPLPEDIRKEVTNKKNSKKKASSTLEEGSKQDTIPFAAIPYEATAIVSSTAPTTETIEASKQQPHKLSKALSKVFHSKSNFHQQASKTNSDATTYDEQKDTTHQEENEPVVIATSSMSTEDPPHPASEHLVSLIAQRLRNNSIDYDDDDDTNRCQHHPLVQCDCSFSDQHKQEEDGIQSSPKRLSVMLIPDEERRHSFELRRKRGASIDMIERSAQPDPGEQGSMQRQPSSVVSIKRDATSQIATCSNISLQTGKESRPTRLSSAISIATNTTQSNQRSSILSPVAAISTTTRRASLLTHDNAFQQQQQQQAINSGLTHIPRSPSTHQPYNGRPSFILFYRTSHIASQLCLIERDVLIKVGWEELIHCKWTKMDPNGNIQQVATKEDDTELDTPLNYTRHLEQRRIREQGIEQVIQRFNTVCQWVASEIVRTRNIHDRVKLIEKFIRLAKKCRLYSNYATLVQILLGLQSPAVARLEKTWSKVSSRCQKELGKLTDFTSPMKNWKKIRDSMTEVAEEYGHSPAEVQVELPGTTRHTFKKTTRIKMPFGGCIPFLGIYLSDLVFNSEKPRLLTPRLDHQRIYHANSTAKWPDCLNQPLVNFRKHRVIATVIKRVLTFQGLAMRYSFDEDLMLLEKCRDLQVSDATKIRELSISLE
ncbi:MAG: hypothetical protein EXX96DRAFT_620078 [Benjaminiella poitrasii]|nr:MAG: hypothetical protein EXX96DRAFT_620078 [Benjaminiella poitrasii]